ncbi:hypothetical protein CK203_105545 [Vitis vinifera]|uniref:DUF659 domain-containing protein n=1 Tax=Vitis vinifera TaxID=29760 RepID=A0A438BQK4_VITVI|nr:hypothetical protein CK203_105545 [Vitis vinifera]
MKQHLPGVKGDIGPCKSVPPDGIWQKVKKRFKKCKVLWQLIVESGKRKKSTVDKYFAPRNTQRAQPSMSVLAGKEAIWRADIAIGRFFYDACIPINAVNSLYFKPILNVISAIGPGYIDNRQRILINFLVYCPERISFVKSVDASDIVKNATNLFQLFDEVIEWVGPLNVVHIVTDNAANYVAVGRLISQKHKHINWSPCATHCLNLIFKDISKMDHVAELVKRASNVTIFVYNHVTLLSWLRKREGWTEILRPGATRFATTFIALKSLHDKNMTCKLWPSMGYVYEGMYRVRLGIKKLFNYNERLYKPYTEIIKQRWDQQLKKSIHSAAYWWNPCFQYDQENFCNKPNVIGGVMDVIDQKVLKGKLETMNEMKFYNKKRIYDPIYYACIDETDFWVVDDDQPVELDVEELENLLYEERSIPINEVEGSSSHIDDEDGGDVAIEGLDVENFGFPNAHVRSPYSNFQNE